MAKDEASVIALAELNRWHGGWYAHEAEAEHWVLLLSTDAQSSSISSSAPELIANMPRHPPDAQITPGLAEQPYEAP